MSATLNGSQEATGAVLSPPEPELGHPTTPEPYSALDAARDFLTRYIALSDIQADTLALWCAHTWAIDSCEVTPYISVQSIEPGSGKTIVLETCEQIVSAPWLTGRTTGPALVRKVAQDKPTLLLDEVDACFTGGATSQQMLRGVLNSGYRRGGKVSYAQGGGFVDLPVFCPKMFAGLTALPGTVADRSIPILMRKKTAFDRVERFRQRDVRQAAGAPREMLIRFAITHLEKLERARPETPSGLDDRASDVWEPLLAIADVVGGSWPGRARKAAVELMKTRKHTNGSGVGFKLLTECRDLFSSLGVTRMQTSQLLVLLNQSERERPLDAISLADGLRGFGISPGKHRFGKTTAQGYEVYGFDTVYTSLMPVPDETIVS